MNNEKENVKSNEEGRFYQSGLMTVDRSFVPFKERFAYAFKNITGGLSMGDMGEGKSIYKFNIFKLRPKTLARKQLIVTVYDMINDPLTAFIQDNMRTRWGKFKPFQYLALIPSSLLSLFICFMPLIGLKGDLDSDQRITMFITMQILSETIGAIFGGGGHIDKVFTPNPNERTSLLNASNFLSSSLGNIPSYIAMAYYDKKRSELNEAKENTTSKAVMKMLDNEFDRKLVNMYTYLKLPIWALVTASSLMWTLYSKERVIQADKPPAPTRSIKAVFTNKPLMLYTFSGAIDDINISGNGAESLYKSLVLGVTGFGTIFGIPGTPISYLSYFIYPKLREMFSTKTLWFFKRGSVLVSEAGFFLVGFLGRRKKLYSNFTVMGIAFAVGNMIEMSMYALKHGIEAEITYEINDYCEWKNGFRVEATQGAIVGYMNKLKNALLNIVNADLLERTGFREGMTMVKDEKTRYRMFILAYGLKLIPDVISMIPMLFYNISEKERERMYSELAYRRTQRVNSENET